MLAPLTGPPRHVGPYRLLARIGAGGMGEVFLARARPGTPLVAVKTVRSDLDIDHEFRVRFRREIAAARAVSGPGTAALLDGDADAEVPWLATEYVAGPALGQTVRRCGPLPVGAVRALGARLAHALGTVHLAQVLHRDLKPGNVLLAPDGPRLIDFGIAQAFDATALTTAGMIVGTPGYLAPEQLLGSHAVVPASDVFALGAVLAYAASGRGPFDDQEIASVIFRITQGDADLSGVPRDEGLRETVAACLAPAPEDRPTAAELAGRLEGPSAAVPWPAEVLSLFAEHREAVQRCEQAVREGEFAAADTVTGGSATGGSPGEGIAAAPPRAPALSSAPAPVAPPARPRWPWIAAAALAVSAVTLAAVLLPGGDSGGGGGGAGREAGASGGAGGAGSPAGPGGERRPLVVSEYGNAHRTGDHGPEGLRAAARPKGWKPWSVPRPEGLDDRGDGCVLAGATLVCRDGKGAAAGLDAASGRHRWTTRGFPGRADELTGNQAVPPEAGPEGRAVYVPSELGVTKVDVASGAERWRKPTATGSGVLGVAYAKDVVYVVEFRLGGSAPGEAPGSSVVRARAASDGRELWRSKPLPKTAGPLVVDGGRVFTALEKGGVVRLDAKSGRTARTASVPCDDLMLRTPSSLACWSRGSKGVRELDPATLRTRRVVAADVRPSGPRPVLGPQGVLVVASDNPDPTAVIEHELSAYDWRTGDRRWRYGAPNDLVTLALAGDRVLSAGAFELRGLRLDGDVGTLRTKEIPKAGPTGSTDPFATFGKPLYAGGAVFTTTAEGKVLSGNAP
ncbi:protein kinase domain-containing protein [Streptomyces sp. NRRL B-1347]|uniref:serine/threonine-protein kinase n=1 Tax=Streptomyces sp. NRRL B-1347 TaxID=1476877 RepID=UPI00068EE059|nr:serine/threonine-protein kinase [Streptomyces sp. NRRL B-1347]